MICTFIFHPQMTQIYYFPLRNNKNLGEAPLKIRILCPLRMKNEAIRYII